MSSPSNHDLLASSKPAFSSTRLFFSFLSVFLNAVTAGSIFTFPLYSPYISSIFFLSQSQTNAIAISGVLGQYFTAPVWGNFIDKRGPGKGSYFAALLFFVGYTVMATLCVLSHSLSPAFSTFLLCLSYFIAGSATGASYFASIITLSLSLPASSSGLAIGLPCAIFGLSPLFLSEIAVQFFTVGKGGSGEEELTLDGQSWLVFLAIFLGLVNVLGGSWMKVIKVGDHTIKVLSSPNEDNDSATLEGGEVSSTTLSDDFRDSGFASSETTPLIKKKAALEPEEKSLVQFLTSWETIRFGMVLILVTGPAEMIMSSLGSIIASLLRSAPPPKEVSIFFLDKALLTRLSSIHVQFLSVSNTLSRLLVGVLSDKMYKKGYSRMIWMLFATTLLTGVYSYAAFGIGKKWGEPGRLWILSIGTGLGYGVIFTMSPSILRTLHPPSQLGRNWGLLSNFSALGAVIYTALYGILADRVEATQPHIPGEGCRGRGCFKETMEVAVVGGIVATGIVVGLWRGTWRGRV